MWKYRINRQTWPKFQIYIMSSLERSIKCFVINACTFKDENRFLGIILMLASLTPEGITESSDLS